MHRLVYLCFIYTGILLLQGCCHSSSNRNLIVAADYVETNCDSADSCILLIDPERLNEEDLATYALLRTVVDAKQGKTLQSDSLVRLAYNYYAKASDFGESDDTLAVGRFSRASMYLGDWYAMHDSIILGEKAWRQAVKCASKSRDWHTEYCTLSRLAKRMSDENNQKEALRLIQKAIEVYNKCKDNERNYYLSLVHDAATYAFFVAYETDKDFTQAFRYLESICQFSKKQNLEEGINQSHIAYTNFYLDLGENQKALEHARKIMIEEEQQEKSMIQRQILAECYMRCDSIQQAIALYQYSLHSQDTGTRYIAFRNLGKLMLQIHVNDSAATYFDSAFNCEERMYFDAMKVKEDYCKEVVKQEKVQDELQFQAKLRSRLAYTFIAFLLLLGVFICWGLISRLRTWRERQRNLLKTRKMELEQHIMEKLHNQKEMQMLADKVKQREVMVKFLQDYIIERLDIVKRMNEAKGTHITLKRKEWMDIERVVDEIDNHSISKLRERMRHFQEEDIRLCILVRLRMSNAVIGSLYGISVSAVQHRKLKLKKEGFGILNADMTLEQAITSV